MDNPVEKSNHSAFHDYLEQMKKSTSSGVSYWYGREIATFLGYVDWRNFEAVVEKAWTSLLNSDVEPSHHIVETTKLMKFGKGAERSVKDLFLTRAACYIVAMNADPKKPEVAAAQNYFAVKTRQREEDQAAEHDPDEKRLDHRQRVTDAFKQVSGTAIEAGVQGKNLGIFHDHRYKGLYGVQRRKMMEDRGFGVNDNPFDRMGSLELSANEFQMNLAAETIKKEGISSQADAYQKNMSVGERVRRTMLESGSLPPEELPLAEPIKDVKKRVGGSKKKSLGKEEKP